MKGAIPLMPALLMVTVVFLFTRMPEPELLPPCLKIVTIGKWAHFVHICDTTSYINEMVDPVHFLTETNAEVTRPIYVEGAALLAALLKPVAIPLQALLSPLLAGDAVAAEILRRFPAYLALATVNFVVLGLAVSLALRFGGARTSRLAAALGLAVVTCDLVHGLFWSQHPSFVNVLIPLATIYYFIEGCRARQLTYGRVTIFGFGAAIATLTYAFAIIWLPAFVLGTLFWECGRSGDWRRTVGVVSRSALVMVLAGCGPVLAWAAICKFYLHGYWSYEAESYRQFIWLIDAWRANNIIQVMWSKWHEFFPQAVLWLGWPGLVACVAAAALLTHGRVPIATIIRDPVIGGILVTIAAMILFNFLQGYYQPRLSNGMALALFVAVARAAQLSNLESIGAAVLATVSLGQVGLAFVLPAITLT